MWADSIEQRGIHHTYHELMAKLTFMTNIIPKVEFIVMLSSCDICRHDVSFLLSIQCAGGQYAADLEMPDVQLIYVVTESSGTSIVAAILVIILICA